MAQESGTHKSSTVSKRRSKQTKVPFDQYKRQGKRLLSPFSVMREKIPVEVSAWEDAQLPEYLWMLLIFSQAKEHSAHDLMRGLVEHWPSVLPPTSAMPGSHSSFAEMRAGTRRKLIRSIVGIAGPNVLRPLRLFNDLPSYSDWHRELPVESPDEDWPIVGNGIAFASQFHSEIATDICWAMNLVGIKSGATIEPPDSELDKARSEYPFNRDEWGGFFRAGAGNERIRPRTAWLTQFWDGVFMKYSSQPLETDLHFESQLPIWLQSVLPFYIHSLEKHFFQTRKGSKDFTHEILFGLMFQSAFLAHEVVQLRAQHCFAGLAALRSITECTINLSFLLKRNDEKLWISFREHGYGRAQMIVEKHSHNSASCVDRRWVKSFGSEEKAWYHTDINLGDWSGEDIRKRSETGGTKDLYDLYYDYASSLLHADWLGVNAFGLTRDVNPFHRRQHIPRHYLRKLPSVLPDMFLILNRQVDLLQEALPGFEMKLPVLKTDLETGETRSA